ncbi:MAG TPA: dynamin family protein [Desulfobacterales bacterium]
MKDYRDYKEDLLEVNAGLASVVTAGLGLPGMPRSTFAEWERVCSDLRRRLSEDVLRIAVIGAIKSGKSTFLNMLLEGDYLRRGAGVVTSIVTRIRRGNRKKATVFFKSWPEINHEIAEAVAMLPGMESLGQREKFDLRNAEQRRLLDDALTALPPEQLINHGGRNLNTVLLNCYLSGYERIRSWITEDNRQSEFEAGEFRRHWEFVGEDALAVYLKDIELEIETAGIETETEFADCQGSDSPNPLHLALIQDYLQLAHFIVYVVSSRTGLREADIRFLSLVAKMGISGNALFVVNCDVSEHDSLTDLQRVVDRVKEELRLVHSDPRVFSVSALYHLFDHLRDSLSEKDQLRQQQWQAQPELVDFSSAELRRFQSDLGNLLLEKRSRLLLRNQIERHRIILSGVNEWIRLNRELLRRNRQEARQIVEDITGRQQQMQQIRSMIETTAAGAAAKIKQEINLEVNRFFDSGTGGCLGKVVDIIRAYQIDLNKYRSTLHDGGFSNALYLVFQEFKQALDKAMTGTIYPEVVRFTHGQEEKIETYYRSIYEPFEGIVEQALMAVFARLQEMELTEPASDDLPGAVELPSVESVKNAAGLKLPPMVAFLRYSAKIKTEAFLNLGFFSLLQGFQKLLRKNRPAGESQVRALKRSVDHMKKLTEESLLFQCKDYRENLKFRYLYKLVDAVSQAMAETVLSRFQTFGSDTATALQQIQERHSGREEVGTAIAAMDRQTSMLGDQLQQLKIDIDANKT